jgi:hypothetical protein
MLAFQGNPMGGFEDRLLRKSVDLVIPHVTYLEHIKAVAPRTPGLIYTNTSSLYLNLLTDWLNFADAHGLYREAAFYHAARPVGFSGNSPSSQPVTWFWAVYRGGRNGTDLTKAAHTGTDRVAFGSAGESLYLGYPERFREIHIALSSSRRAGWTFRLEYARRVGAAGKPRKWAALPVRTDTTTGLKRSGQITFDPPAHWKTASLNGSPRLFFVRFRTGAAGQPPVATSILGRDYVEAHGTEIGRVPVFDSKADVNLDGYLDDQEYARRTPGKDARFLYESRMPTEQYGQMRFSTNPHSAAFRRWAVVFHVRVLKRHPLASGLFMDNCDGRAPVPADVVRESVAGYAQDYGLMLQEIGRAIRPHWLLGNTVLNARADPVVQYNPAYMEEFAIRPLAHHWSQFEDLAEAVGRRSRLVSPPPLAILDSHPQGGSPTSPRMLRATLAYYFLLSDPKYTFLMFNGGFEPASPWQRHWVPAASYNIGKPLGKWSVWQTGADPANRTLTYKIYQRPFQKALVLYKPLSHAQGSSATPGLGKETATRHDLGGVYRPLKADGNLGRRRRRVELRNGEGAILVKDKNYTAKKDGHTNPKR